MSSARAACSAIHSARLAPMVRYPARDSERLAPNARLSLRWADVDLAAVRANCARILDHLPKGTRLLAVVKADGYGHGALPVARAAVEGGATGLAVATLEEAQALGGLISVKDILVMGGLTQAQ